MSAWDTCWMPDCGGRPNRDLRAELPTLCYEHGLEIARAYTRRIVADEERKAIERAERVYERRQREAGNREGALVYYALIGDYIKIGFSTRLRNRLTTLRVDHLLAIEPGGPEMERERHHDFAIERIDLRRENFRPSERLLDHIEHLRERYGLPHWATRPRTTTISRRHMEEA